MTNSKVHNHSDDHSLDRTNIVVYTAIEKREGLSTIARRLLRHVHLRTSVRFPSLGPRPARV